MGQIILRLDRVMADRKMSLNELSARVGVANVNLSKMKNGHISAIRFSTLAAICDVLNCQPGDILDTSLTRSEARRHIKNGIVVYATMPILFFAQFSFSSSHCAFRRSTSALSSAF